MHRCRLKFVVLHSDYYNITKVTRESIYVQHEFQVGFESTLFCIDTSGVNFGGAAFCLICTGLTSQQF